MALEPVEVVIALLMASVASAVITSVILADGVRRHIYSAAAGLAGGLILQLTPAHKVVASYVGDLHWAGPPVVGLLFAVGLSALADALLSSKLPLFGRLRLRGRRSLRASHWGTAEEIAALTNFTPGEIRAMHFGVEATPMTAARALARFRIAANVVTGSCVVLFFVVPEFRKALGEILTPGHVVINLVATAVGTFFLGPLHEQFLHLATRGGAHDAHDRAPSPAEGRGLWPQLGLFALLAVPLFLLQAVHSAADKAFQTMEAYQWIVLLEACALPLIVTTYYFGAALHRPELGDVRWDRALGASIWFGAIVLVPFGIAVMLPNAFDPDLRDSIVATVTRREGSLYVLLVGLLVAYAVVLIAIALAVVASWATYGIYALALGIAMSYATPANARLRGCASILIAGAVAQAITSGVISWWQVPVPELHFVHAALAIGWAIGLFLSRFEKEM